MNAGRIYWQIMDFFHSISVFDRQHFLWKAYVHWLFCTNDEREMLKKYYLCIPKQQGGVMNSLCLHILLGGLLLLFACSSPSTRSTGPVIAPVEGDSTTTTTRKEPRFMQNREGSTHGTAIILVDDNLRQIIEAEISTFEALFPEADIQPRFVPGEQAIKQMLANDSIRMAISTRRMTQEEEIYLRAKNISPKYAGVAKTAIAIVVHPDNPFKQLRMDQLIGILTGKITNWDQLQGGNRSGEIALVFDHPQSSTLRFLADSILEGRPLTKEGIFAQQNTPEMIQYVATNRNAIGLGGWNWISDVDEPMTDSLRQSVKLVWLGRDTTERMCLYQEEFVGPYQGYLVQRCYPLTQTITTVLRESNYGPATGFVSHLDGPQGQRIIHKGGLATVHAIDREIRLPAKEGAQPIREKLPDPKKSTK